MKKRRSRILELRELLPQLARERGAERLRRPALEARVRRALGGWLGARLLSCRRDGACLELEIAGGAAAGEAEALAGELLQALRRQSAGEAPERLRVVVGRSPSAAPRAPMHGGLEPGPEPGPAASEALEAIEDPRLRAQLARIVARATSMAT